MDDYFIIRQLVRARFTRSFLAQIIGLRVHYKYFEQDDPDLYLSKIKYIEEHDVDGMDLYFVEEEYCSNGQLIKTVELIPNGSKVNTFFFKLKYYYYQDCKILRQGCGIFFKCFYLIGRVKFISFFIHCCRRFKLITSAVERCSAAPLAK